jgi:hypothetical protein
LKKIDRVSSLPLAVKISSILIGFKDLKVNAFALTAGRAI